MTTKIGVFYFSGTGNTELITQLIEAALMKIQSMLRRKY